MNEPVREYCGETLSPRWKTAVFTSLFTAALLASTTTLARPNGPDLADLPLNSPAGIVWEYAPGSDTSGAAWWNGSESITRELNAWNPGRPFCEIGLLVTEDLGHLRVVQVEGSAERAGVRPGDWLLAINGRRIATVDQYDLRTYPPGARVSLGLERNGQALNAAAVCEDGSLHLERLTSAFGSLRASVTGTAGSGSSADRRGARRCGDKLESVRADRMYLDPTTALVLGWCTLWSPRTLSDELVTTLSNTVSQLDLRGRALLNSADACEHRAYLTAAKLTMDYLLAGIQQSSNSGQATVARSAMDARWFRLGEEIGGTCNYQVAGVVTQAPVAVAPPRPAPAPVRTTAPAMSGPQLVSAGMKLWEGDGVPRDRAAGLDLWRQAAAMGDTEAQVLVRQVEAQLGESTPPPTTPTPVRQALPVAVPPSAPLRNAPAVASPSMATSEVDQIYGLAQAFRTGTGRIRNYRRAYALFLVAAGKGHPSAGRAATELEEFLPPQEILAGQTLAEELWNGSWRDYQ
jgi:TPR repeat protein